MIVVFAYIFLYVISRWTYWQEGEPFNPAKFNLVFCTSAFIYEIFHWLL